MIALIDLVLQSLDRIQEDIDAGYPKDARTTAQQTINGLKKVRDHILLTDHAHDSQ